MPGTFSPPPVYRPAPVLQQRPAPPPVYRPSAQPRRAAAVPPGVFQMKRAVEHRPPPPVYRPAVRRGNAAQPKVGFEFETNWYVKGPLGSVGFHKAIIKGTGWHITGDSPGFTTVEQYASVGVGKGTEYKDLADVEFVTDAFDEDPEDREKLKQTLLEIKHVAQHLASAKSCSTNWFGTDDVKAATAIGGPVTWGEHLESKKELREGVVFARTGPLTAAPQMSAGVKMERLYKLLSDVTANQKGFLGADPGYLQQEYQYALTKAREIARRHEHPINSTQNFWWDFDKKKYEGVLALLGIYARMAWVLGPRLPYDKAVSALLSRTSFGKLPGWVRKVPTLIADVVEASGRSNPKASLFRQKLEEAEEKYFLQNPEKKPKFWYSLLSTEAWVQGIIDGKDPIVWGQTDRPERWKPGHIGQFLDKSKGHVYEFRGLRKGVGVADWDTFALDLYDYIVALNRGDLGYPDDPESYGEKFKKKYPGMLSI